MAAAALLVYTNCLATSETLSMIRWREGVLFRTLFLQVRFGRHSCQMCLPPFPLKWFPFYTVWCTFIRFESNMAAYLFPFALSAVLLVSAATNSPSLVPAAAPFFVPPASCRPVPAAAAALSALSQPAVSRPVTAPRYLKQVTLLHLKVHFIENKIYLMHPQWLNLHC